MKSLPLVSILIPAYNAGPWIGESIASALAQTWKRKEIIVVDDGSKDDTLAIARRFEPDGILVVTQGNAGAAAARNTAFSLSRGDYIQWLDADDLLAPNKIALQLAAGTDKRSTLFSSSWGQFHYRVSKAKFRPSPLWCDLSPTEWLLRKMEHNCHMQTATWLVSREITQAAGPWDVRLLGDDDGEYFCRVKLASEAIKFAPAAKVFYRSVGDNRLSFIGASNRKMDAQFLSMQLHLAYVKSLEDSARSRVARLKYLQKYMFDFTPERPDIVEQMQRLAGDLGGRLVEPKSSWKYMWIQALFGWGAAKKAQTVLPRYKSSIIKLWDKFMYRLVHRKSSDCAGALRCSRDLMSNNL